MKQHELSCRVCFNKYTCASCRQQVHSAFLYSHASLHNDEDYHQVTREEMWHEMNYTCGVNHDNTPRLDEMVITEKDVYETCKDSHAVCILTEWDEFKSLDWKRIFDSMAKPAFVFDGRLLLDHKALREVGFEVHAIGKPDPFKFPGA